MAEVHSTQEDEVPVAETLIISLVRTARISGGQGLSKNLRWKAEELGLKYGPEILAERRTQMKSIFGVVILMAISSAAQAQEMTNTKIILLRALYQDLASRAADIEARVGPNHIAVVKVRERMDELRKQIQEEERRIWEDG